MFGELLVNSSFFAPSLVWKLGLHLLAEKAEKMKAKGKELNAITIQIHTKNSLDEQYYLNSIYAISFSL